MTNSKLLFLDIETAPNKAYVWGLYDQNIAHDHVEESSYILCWSAKWYKDKTIMFGSMQHTPIGQMLKPIHDLLDQAEIVVHYNGAAFDIPILNREFILHSFKPPSPYKQIDLLRIVKRLCKFESNKLVSITKRLGLTSKIDTSGFQLWVDCMNGKAPAWAEMKKYNMNDTAILEPLYERLRPWMKNHPSVFHTMERETCPRCGNVHVQKRGIQIAVSKQYVRYQCMSCGGWFRGTKSLSKESTTHSQTL